MKSYLAKPKEIQRRWYLIDASDQILGRLAVKIADVLRGRRKPTYTPHVDTGDFVVVINAEKIRLTGRKEDDKRYMFYTGWMGNEKYLSVREIREKKPEFLLEHAVKGMLPKNRLADSMLKKLKVHSGPEHPHTSQNPSLLETTPYDRRF